MKKMSAGRKRDVGVFLRYAMIGLAQNIAFYLVTLVLIASGLKAWQATLLLYPAATILSFLANRAWSFRGRQRRGAEFYRYVLVYVAVYPVAVLLNWIQEAAGMPAWLASLVTVGASAAILFIALNNWVFRS